MAASTLTLRDWVYSQENNVNIWTCKITATTADYDIYTKKTPLGLDPTKPWTLVLNTLATSVDGEAVPVDLYIGWDSSFALTLNNPPTVTGGVLYKADIMDDVDALCVAILMHPNLTVAEDVAAGAAKCYVPIAPYYIIDLDGNSALEAVSVTFKIMQ
jgi:hypothetical protein